MLFGSLHVRNLLPMDFLDVGNKHCFRGAKHSALFHAALTKQQTDLAEHSHWWFRFSWAELSRLR